MRQINRCTNQTLQEICKRAIQLEELKQKVNEFLPEFLRPYCFVGSFTKGCLILIAKDTVWSSQLRYSLPDLRDKLRKEGGFFNLTTIKISSIQEETPTRFLPKQTPIISSKARSIIIDQAESCTYLPLKEALRHLADKPLRCLIPVPDYEKNNK
jgi:hypothetical protein